MLQVIPSSVAGIPFERLNLLCAIGLCATNRPDLNECAATLRSWAKQVQSETQRHQYRYDRNPTEFENSPGFYRMLMLSVVLAEDYGVHYDPQRRAGPAASRIDDGFFNDPASVFVHGLLGPERKGTCSSLPVLYVALGRHLGYPLKLVTTKGHLFVRWEGAGERFNIEATGHGLNRFDDEYYRHWPFDLSPGEEEAEGYLKSLTPAEELAVFLSIRGMCLRDQGRLPEAAESFAAAARLAPACHGYRKMLASLETDLSKQSLKTGARTARN
ncbi:MAG TPA: transglutaminase family protein [Verrucomicrobiae bacterium]